MTGAIVFVVTGWSGFFVMSLELLGGRILAPSFGNSIFVWGALIAVFMMALAVGYLLGGFWSARRARARDLGWLLLLQAVTTLSSVLLSDTILDWIFANVEDVRYGSLLAATCLFFMPTMVSGMVSPCGVRLLVPRAPLSGQYAGLLFFVSTFGSAAGTILTSFYFVLWFEVNHILYGLSAVSIGLGLLAVGWRDRTAV
jgi:MFS family permease